MVHQEKKGACDCGWEKVKREANAALMEEKKVREESVARYEDPEGMKRGKQRSLTAKSPSWRAEFVRQATLALLVSIGLAFALPAYAQTASRCWQPVRPAAVPACADSLAVSDTLTAQVPFARPIATGMQMMVAAGDTIQLQATIIRGYLFVGPTKAGRKPNTPPGTLWAVSDPQRLWITPEGRVMGLSAGKAIVTATQGGRKSTAEVIATHPYTPVELPRVYLNTSMPPTPAPGGKVIPVGAP
jgi:hypothetical protein